MTDVLPKGLGLNDILEVNGIKFTNKQYIPEVTPGGSYANFKGLTSFGRLVHDCTFKDCDGLLREMKNLDSVRRIPVYRPVNEAVPDEDGGVTWPTENEGKYQVVPNRFSLVSNKTNTDYEIVSGKYRIIQDVDLFQPLYNAAVDMGLKPVGSVWGVGTGTTNAMVMFNNPEFIIPTLHRFEDPIAIGFHLRNSYGVNSVFAKAVGFRMVCCNYNWWGELLGQFAFKHFVEVDDMQTSFEGVIKTALARSPQLMEVMQNSLGTPVDKADVANLLFAVIPDYAGLIEEIAVNPLKFCPEIAQLGLNQFTIYNASTAGHTHRMTSGNMDDYDGVGQRLTKLLTMKQDDLLEEGRRNHKAYLEAEIKKMKEKTVEKAKSTIARRV